MDEIASLFAKIGADVTDLELGLTKAIGGMEKAGQRIAQAGDRLSMAVTLPLLAIGTIASKTFVGLDEQMRNIQSISKESDDSLGMLQDRFVAMSRDITVTTDTATALATGFYDVQSSGFRGADAMEVLTRATKAATAGLSTTQVAAKAITATLNAYGKGADEAAEISDLMFRTVDRGVVTFGELSMSLSNTLSSAANAGIEFETVAAAIATMTKQGLDASEATTSLNQTILSLIDPSDKLKDAFRELGYESGGAALQALGLQGTLDLLVDAGFDSTEEMAQLFNNVRALRGVLSLTGKNAQLFTDDLLAMESAVGATEEAFAIQTKSLSAQFKNLRNDALGLAVEFGQSALPMFERGIEIGKELVSWFGSLNDEQKENILAWGLIAVAAGPALKVIGTGIQIFSGLSKAVVILNAALVATPGFIGSVGAGLALISEGAGVFAVASTGAAGLVAALLPIVGVLAAVTVAYLQFKHVQASVAEGTQAVESAWGSFFSEMTAKGATAAQIADEYRAAQDRVTASLESGGIIADLFIRNQDELINATGELNKALVDASTSYDEYQAAASSAGLTTEALTQAQYDARKGIDATITSNDALLKNLAETSETYEDYVAAARDAGLMLRVVSREEYATARSTKVTEQALAELAETTGGPGGVAESIFKVDDALKLVQTGLTDAGLNGAAATEAMNQLGLAMGAVTQEQLDQDRVISELTAAYTNKIITLDQLAMYMKKVQDGTMNAGHAFEFQIVAHNQGAEAARNAAAAYQELILKQQGLSEALKGASQAEVARAAIQELTAAYDAGTLSFPNYTTAVGEVQKTFGLVDEKSIALSGGLLAVNQALLDGTLPATNYDEALKSIIQDAGDGALNLQASLDKFLVMPAAVDPATESVTGFDEEMEKMPDIAKTAIGEVETAWTATPWPELGTSAGQGIADGITASTPAIVAAAEAAARAAILAAQHELGVHSPSKEFMYLGRMADEGMALGMGGGKASQAARTSVRGMLEGGARETGQGSTSISNTNADAFEFNFYDAGTFALGMAEVQTIRRARLSASMAR